MTDHEEVPEQAGVTRRDTLKLVGAVAALGAALGIRPVGVIAQGKSEGKGEMKGEGKGAAKGEGKGAAKGEGKGAAKGEGKAAGKGAGKMEGKSEMKFGKDKDDKK